MEHTRCRSRRDSGGREADWQMVATITVTNAAVAAIPGGVRRGQPLAILPADKSRSRRDSGGRETDVGIRR